MTPKTADLVPVAAQLPQMSPTELVDTIKQTVAKGATDAELNMFLAVCKRYDLDPFAKELFFIKEKPSEPGRIQAGRDAYLAIANRHPAYEGMTSDVVFVGDTFRRTESGVDHQYDLSARKGTIIGAYAVVYRSDRRIPSYAFARFSEYAPSDPTKGWSPWHKFPSAMILKVAETAALKKAFSISGLTPIGISEPDDDYVEEAPMERQPATIPFAAATGRDFGHFPSETAPRPEPATSPSQQGEEPPHDYVTAEEFDEIGQTRLDDEVDPA